MVVDELVDVRTTVAGSPMEFEWRARRYQMTELPLRFFIRHPWWTEQNRIQKGIGAQVLETEVWRVTAAGRGRSAERVFELTHENSHWRLSRILG